MNGETTSLPSVLSCVPTPFIHHRSQVQRGSMRPTRGSFRCPDRFRVTKIGNPRVEQNCVEETRAFQDVRTVASSRRSRIHVDDANAAAVMPWSTGRLGACHRSVVAWEVDPCLSVAPALTRLLTQEGGTARVYRAVVRRRRTRSFVTAPPKALVISGPQQSE